MKGIFVESQGTIWFPEALDSGLTIMTYNLICLGFTVNDLDYLCLNCNKE